MSQYTSIWEKILISIVTSALLIFVGFIGVIYSSLMGGLKFYTPFIIVVIVGLIIFYNLNVFNLLRPKVFKISLYSFLSLCVMAVLIYEANKAYHNSFATVTDQEVNLYAYQPFRKGTLAVSLDEPATLQLEKDLPIMDGATALYPVYSAFARAVYPEKEYEPYQSEVMSNKTGDAYRNLIKGEVDIIFAAGPSERQLNQAKLNEVELILTPIGREAFVFFVNARNPVESLTIEQIQGIYSGQITNWKEVGGNNEAIRAFQRPADSGSQTALEGLMGDIPLMEPPKEDVIAGMGGIIAETADYRNYKNALGYSFRFYSTEMVRNGEIKHLKINGVFPDKETIRSGEYPLASEFYAITAGSENPHVEALIEWILSKQGQSLVEKTGYVPVK